MLNLPKPKAIRQENEEMESLPPHASSVVRRRGRNDTRSGRVAAALSRCCCIDPDRPAPPAAPHSTCVSRSAAVGEATAVVGEATAAAWSAAGAGSPPRWPPVPPPPPLSRRGEVVRTGTVEGNSARAAAVVGTECPRRRTAGYHAGLLCPTTSGARGDCGSPWRAESQIRPCRRTVFGA